MASIEERANQLRPGSVDPYTNGIRNAYIKGATEQREEDFQKFEAFFDKYCGFNPSIGTAFRAFKKKFFE